jgi:hypothetical protein
VNADFIVLDANPIDDITNTRKIVILRGAAVERGCFSTGTGKTAAMLSTRAAYAHALFRAGRLIALQLVIHRCLLHKVHMRSIETSIDFDTDLWHEAVAFE